MKRLAMVALLMVFRIAGAEDLTAVDGTVYRNVKIISADPERMLVVHDGGGCQVEFADLVPESLTRAQRAEVERLLKTHVERQERREKLRIEKEAFELAQRQKGLVLFEGNWMTPTDQQKIITLREVAKLERERMKMELEQQRVALKTAQLKANQGDKLLEGDRNRQSTVFYTGRNYPSFGHSTSAYPYYINSNWGARRSVSGGLHIRISGSHGSFSYGIR
jgi:hypothetical protein